MAVKVRRAQTLDVKLDPKPGALFQVYSAFKEAGINVLGSWGYEMGPGEAQAHFCVEDIKKGKEVLAKLGKKPTISNICFAEGEDSVGAYANLLEKVQRAKVNVEATDALAVGGKFATVFFVDEKDYETLCKALSC